MARVLSDETSLAREKKRLTGESGTLSAIYKVELAVAAALLFAGAGVYVVRGSTGLLIVGGIAAFLCFGHFFKIRENARQSRNIDAGRRGEVQVTRSLREALDDSYYIFNDLLVKHGRRTAQLDHLVVSPKGLFIIETKNWAGHLEGDEKDEIWTQTKRTANKPIQLKSPMKQNERHLEVLRAHFAAAGIDWPDVFSLLVISNPSTTYKITNQSVPILRPKAVGTFIRSFQPYRTYVEEEVDAVLNLLMKST